MQGEAHTYTHTHRQRERERERVRVRVRETLVGRREGGATIRGSGVEARDLRGPVDTCAKVCRFSIWWVDAP